MLVLGVLAILTILGVYLLWPAPVSLLAWVTQRRRVLARTPTRRTSHTPGPRSAASGTPTGDHSAWTAPAPHGVSSATWWLKSPRYPAFVSARQASGPRRHTRQDIVRVPGQGQREMGRDQRRSVAVTEAEVEARAAWTELPLLIRAAILIAVGAPCLLVAAAIWLLLAYLAF